MAAKDVVILSKEEYLLKVRENVDRLKARVRVPSYFASRKKQDRIRLYFMERAIQVGEAAFRIADLEMPLCVLARVLCEDFFLLYWISLSKKNASEFDQGAVSEMAKLLRVNVVKGRARIRSITTGKNVTETFLPKLDKLKVKRNLEQIAKASGLSRVYDVVYRFDSLHVHGNTFGLERENRQEGPPIALSAINAILNVMILLVDKPAQIVTADEVLTTLGMHTLAGA